MLRSDPKAIRRFLAKVDKAGELAPLMTTKCWQWTGKVHTSKRSGAYGRFWDGTYLIGSRSPRFVPAHRFAYEMIVGPISKEMQLDHLCHVQTCVNPDHLEPVTHARNGQRRHGASSNNNSCGIRGVTLHKKTGKWQVQVRQGSASYYGGLFTNVNDADRAAIALRERVFGVDEVRMDYRLKGTI